MKYEPEKLKEKRIAYRKRAICIGMVVALAWTPIVAVCAWHFRFYFTSENRLLGAVVILVAVSAVCFFLALLVEERRSRPFLAELHSLAEEYCADRDVARYREKLLCMKEEPKNMTSEELWYMTLAGLLIKEERYEEAIALFERLEDGAFGEAKEEAQEGKEFVRDLIEKKAGRLYWDPEMLQHLRDLL